MRRMALLFTTIALGAGSGCALLQAAFQKPTLTFVRGSARDLSLEGATLDLVFRVDNPNGVALDLARVDYKLEVDGKAIVAGAPPTGVQIAARGSSELTLPATVRFAELADGIVAALSKPESTYRASGTVGVSTPIGVVELPLSAEGRFALPKLPRVTLGTPRIAAFNPLGNARIVVPLSVHNDNGFALPLGGVKGDVRLAGVAVGRADVGGGEALAASSSRAIEVALEVGVLSAGAAVVQALTQGKGEVAIDGQASIGGLSLPLTIRETVAFTR